jgi:HicB family
MPAGLHGELARAADREGVSLNQFISSALAGSVGWGREESATPTAAAAPKARSRWLMVLLAANLVLVAAAAVTAIVFLIAAWLTG